MTMKPKIIKVWPWMGVQRLEAVEGSKTKITLYDNRLEYHVKYTEKVSVSSNSELEEENRIESVRYIDEQGVKLKSSIVDLSKYIKTEYDNKGNPYKVFVMDIASSSGINTFEIETEEERDQLFDEIYNWNFNDNKIENNENR